MSILFNLDSYRNAYQNVMQRCRLPVLFIGTRTDVPPGQKTITIDQNTDITTYPNEPHISEITALEDLVWTVVPTMGWRRSYEIDNQTTQYWGGRRTNRMYIQSQFSLELQKYYVTSTEENGIDSEYHFDRQIERLRSVFSREYLWAVGLKSFDGYNYWNYLHNRDCLQAVVASGSGITIGEENPEEGTKKVKIQISTAYPDYSFIS